MTSDSIREQAVDITTKWLAGFEEVPEGWTATQNGYVLSLYSPPDSTGTRTGFDFDLLKAFHATYYVGKINQISETFEKSEQLSGSIHLNPRRTHD